MPVTLVASVVSFAAAACLSDGFELDCEVQSEVHRVLGGGLKGRQCGRATAWMASICKYAPISVKDAPANSSFSQYASATVGQPVAKSSIPFEV